MLTADRRPMMARRQAARYRAWRISPCPRVSVSPRLRVPASPYTRVPTPDYQTIRLFDYPTTRHLSLTA